MTRPEAVITLILGPARSSIRPLAYAVDTAIELLFYKHIPMDDILVTKDIYPVVSKRLGKSWDAVSRSIERLANMCWDAMTPELKAQIVGTQRTSLNEPREMIFYLAFYVYYNEPFCDVISREPAVLF